MVTGSPGGRTIINTALETIVNVVDFGMNAQEAVDAPRFHHQWLPDRIDYEKYGLSPDTVKELARRGHTLRVGRGSQGVAQVIVYNSKDDVLEGATDRRVADGAAVGVSGRGGQKQTSPPR
jgi:gamma-glutamyltranspeptidase/glutathione hydrolase